MRWRRQSARRSPAPDGLIEQSLAGQVAAASAEVGSAQAQRYPRLSLSGSVAANRFRSAGVSTDFSTWSIGPLALSLPLFDGGRRAADVDAAKARYDEAAAGYRAKVRQAVREVEEALVSLQSTAARSDDVRIAAVYHYLWAVLIARIY